MEVRWIKLVTDLFDDEKILLLESMPDADSILVIWIKLLCLAGKQNNSGVFLINERIPYTDEMLATIMRRPVNTVRMALKLFEQYGMVEMVNGVITIPNWGKHQDFGKIENYNAYMKNYMSERRAKQKALASGGVNSDVNLTVNKQLTDVKPTEKIREDEDKNREEESIIVSTDTVCSADALRVLEAWNELGLSAIKTVNANTNRSKLLKSRIKEYGVDGVLDAISNIPNSDFLRGDNKTGWVITFDWFLKPNNFIKVYEGNYTNSTAQKTRSYTEMVQNRVTDVDGW